MRKIRVLVVDDSMIFRELLTQKLMEDPQIEVVAKAVDPFDARDKIIEYRPDVMTLDVEMPKMNGIEFLRKLIPQYPQATVVISGNDECLFDAINLGAVDFIKKPDGQILSIGNEFFDELIDKVKSAYGASVQQGKANRPLENRRLHSQTELKEKLIAIGASTGGTVALTTVLTQLKPPLPGIVIVQHIPPVFSEMFARRLDSITAFRVSEGRTGDIVSPGSVYIAPGSKQMIVTRSGGDYRLKCYDGEKVNGHCPSVDVMFDSVTEFASKVVGVLMTGMGSDGAKGLLQLRRSGAHTIGQDQKSSVVYGMPKVAFDIGAVEYQVPLGEIAYKITHLV